MLKMASESLYLCANHFESIVTCGSSIYILYISDERNVVSIFCIHVY